MKEVHRAVSETKPYIGRNITVFPPPRTERVPTSKTDRKWFNTVTYFWPGLCKAVIDKIEDGNYPGVLENSDLTPQGLNQECVFTKVELRDALKLGKVDGPKLAYQYFQIGKPTGVTIPGEGEVLKFTRREMLQLLILVQGDRNRRAYLRFTKRMASMQEEDKKQMESAFLLNGVKIPPPPRTAALPNNSLIRNWLDTVQSQWPQTCKTALERLKDLRYSQWIDLDALKSDSLTEEFVLSKGDIRNEVLMNPDKESVRVTYNHFMLGKDTGGITATQDKLLRISRLELLQLFIVANEYRRQKKFKYGANAN